jgi:hypothetical protein
VYAYGRFSHDEFGSKQALTPLGGSGDGGCQGRVVEKDGDGGGQATKMLGEHFERGRPFNAGRFSFCCHRAPGNGCATCCNSCTPLAGAAHTKSRPEASAMKFEKAPAKLQTMDKAVAAR